jgi:hypothetical protein
MAPPDQATGNPSPKNVPDGECAYNPGHERLLFIGAGKKVPFDAAIVLGSLKRVGRTRRGELASKRFLLRSARPLFMTPGEDKMLRLRLIDEGGLK